MTGKALLSMILDVTIVYYLIYRVLLIIQGTRAVPMLMGLVVIVGFYILSQPTVLDLPTFTWLIEQFIGSLFLIVVVLFQADIRRALTAVGRTQWLSSFRSGAGAQFIDEMVKATSALAQQSIGALIVVERTADLLPFLEDSSRLDARVSKELLYSLFVPERQNPLHDGAVVIREGRIDAAGVFLPMSVNPQIDRTLGTRHRAALGLSEETDALCIVVSEERGTVSLAFEGDLALDLTPQAFRQRLTQLLMKRPRSSVFRRDRTIVPVKPSTQTSAPKPTEEPQR
jgi:diadenylate cyclase